MKIKTIGIPRYLFYTKYKDFIKNYFEYLGYNVVLSSKYQTPQINKSRCLVFNTYQSHINYLINKCDLVIVPYIYENKKEETICPILENINTIISNKIKNIFTFNLRCPLTIIKSTIKIDKNIPKILISYVLARIDYQKKVKKQINRQKELLKSIRKKILIITDEYYEEVQAYLNKEYDHIYSKYLKENIALDYYRNYSTSINIYSIKLMIGSIYYYNFTVDKIIIIYHKKCKYDISKYIQYLPRNIQNKITLSNI